MTVADFSNIGDECSVIADKQGNVHFNISEHSYSYNFEKYGIDEIEEISENNKGGILENVIDDKYGYYVYKNVYDNIGGMCDYELNRCNFDGT